MRGSEREGGQYSTSDKPPRPRPWLRVIASLAIFGFLIGLMFGDLLRPVAVRLEQVEVVDNGLYLWFNEAPQVSESRLDGAYMLEFESLGREQQGELLLAGKPANWRLKRQQRRLQLRVLAARGLLGDWRLEQLEKRWRLSVSLREE
ncbi:MAG: hypothetical protein CMK71_10140 [Pseudomonadaceae bacterium]|nr:hypothetical protein [Pseudomonadaceae bacterium]